MSGHGKSGNQRGYSSVAYTKPLLFFGKDIRFSKGDRETNNDARQICK